jgi:GNAT superfamily N-acetyltransferase
MTTDRFDPAFLTHEVLVAPQRAFVPAEDTEVIERPGLRQLVTPSFRTGGLNEVSFFSASDDEAEDAIDAALLPYRAHGIRFRWNVLPGSRPDDLAERLTRRGLSPSTVCAMARGTDAPRTSTAGVTVTRVDESTLDLFTRAMADGWELDPAPLFAYNRRLLRAPGAPCRLFLAWADGQPAGSASTFHFARSAYLVGAVVLPKYRRLGVYRALTTERLHDAAEAGLGLVTTHARESTSAPLLARAGFDTVCRFSVFSG